MGFGPWEIVIILIILVIIFGAGRLAQVGGAMGKTVHEFRHAVDDTPAAAPAPPPAPPVTCPACHASNPATNKFCAACGATMTAPPVEAVTTPTAETVIGPTGEPAPAEMRTNTCPSCATVNPPGQPFCGQCGTRLEIAA